MSLNLCRWNSVKHKEPLSERKLPSLLLIWLKLRPAAACWPHVCWKTACYFLSCLLGSQAHLLSFFFPYTRTKGRLRLLSGTNTNAFTPLPICVFVADKRGLFVALMSIWSSCSFCRTDTTVCEYINHVNTDLFSIPSIANWCLLASYSKLRQENSANYITMYALTKTKSDRWMDSN